VSAAVSYERVRDQLERLKLEAALGALDTVLEQGQKQERLPVEILDELLGRELATRFERRVATNLRLSGIPAPKTLESFDFEAQPSVPRETIEELATLRFLHQVVRRPIPVGLMGRDRSGRPLFQGYGDATAETTTLFRGSIR